MNWDHINVWLYGIFMAMVGGIGYLVRVIFTNQVQVQLLKEKLDLQDMYRMERDLKLDSQLTELRSDIKTLMRK